MGDKVSKKPLIFNVNWFRLDDEGHFIWPGFGENFRVLKWMIDRAMGKADARETAIGFIPNPEDIETEGLDLSLEIMTDLLSIDNESWLEDVENIKKFYAQFGDKLPKELNDELAKLESNLKK